MYGILASGYGNWPVIKQIAWLLGQIMNGIYNVLDAIGIQNIGICIIIFTVIIYTLMIPLTIKQQKWSKMSAIMQPEMRKIQKKYSGKKDQASMLKQQEELQILYEKYGTSPTGGCLPLLIQMPVLFALYPVVSNIPNYVKGVRDIYMPIVDKIMAVDGFQGIMEKIGEARPVMMSASSYDYSQAGTLVNVLYKFQESTWETLRDAIPSLGDLIDKTSAQVGSLNSFLGINIGEQPLTMLMNSLKTFSVLGIIMAVIIPVMAGLTQFLSVKLSMKLQSPASKEAMADNPMGSSMKTMTYTMPLISVVFGFTLPAGLGLYWAASALVRCVQQLVINRYLSKKSVEELIEENRKKAAKKREKKGTSAKEINKMATQSTKNVTPKKTSNISDAEKEEKLKKAAQYSKNAKPGSLTSKANLVSRYNTASRNEGKNSPAAEEAEKEPNENSKKESSKKK